jgi:hypothetical protein
MLLLVVAVGFASEAGAQPIALPFVVCDRSDTWTRPAPEVQSKIWNDNRYKDPNHPPHIAFEWTHDFVTTEPDSASLSYHSENLAGLWTAADRTSCPRRDAERGSWVEIWALQHRVRMITAGDGIITISADHRDAGFEIVQFMRPAFLGESHVRMRVVTADGTVSQEWVESEPSVFTPVR